MARDEQYLRTMKIDPKQLQKWAHANIPRARAVIQARALEKSERERVDAYERPVFQRYGFTDDEGKPLTNPREIYLVPDGVTCDAYFEECKRAHAEHGWTGDPDHCPALVAEVARIDAENALLVSLGKLTGCDWNVCAMELREKALSLALDTCMHAASGAR